jgi:2-aminoethylphosphonate-pyruvate transaminase
MIESAVILAAGRGSRLGGEIGPRPKGFIEIGGLPIVEWSLRKLISLGIGRVVIGVGYARSWYDRLAERYPGIVVVENPDFAATGSMRTLSLCLPEARGGFLVLESDLIYDRSWLAAICAAPCDNAVLASEPTGAGDEVFIETDGRGRLVNMTKQADLLGRIDAEFVGISKLSQAAALAMDAFAGRDPNGALLEYDPVIASLAGTEVFHVLRMNGSHWAEIDTAEHLQRARATVYPLILEAERCTP